MRARRVVGPTLLAAVAAVACHARGEDLANVLGIVHNSGQYFFSNQDYLDEGANTVLETGTNVIKLEMNAGESGKYQWNSTWPNYTSLTAMAQSSYFQSVFSKPFSTYVITAYSPSIPGASNVDEYWLNGMTAQQEAAEQASFYNLAKYLMTTYNGTGKTFVMEQWEGDWAILDDGTTPRSNQPTATNVQGMIEWINARQAGIDQARAELAGKTDVKVLGALEVNRVVDAMNGDVHNGSAGWATLTNDVLPNTTVDLASYSAYDTARTTSGPDSFANAVSYIAAHLPPTAIYGQNTHSVGIGEFGLAEDSAGAAAVVSMMNNVISTVEADGSPYAMYWEVYSNEVKNSTATPSPIQPTQDSAVNGFYFVKPDGTPATAFHVYLNALTTADPTKANAAGILHLNNLKLAYASGFTKTGATFGTAWTTNTSNGNMSVAVTNGAVTMQVAANASSFPTGLATLNIDSVAGRGLNPGEYLQFTMQRQNDTGFVGISAFGANQGSGSSAGNQSLDVFSTGSWTPISFAADGSHPTYNFDTTTTLGVRLDATDGTFATVSYYINGNYTGSWLYQTSSLTLDTISLFAQSNVLNSSFLFNNFTIYSTAGNFASTAYHWDPAHTASINGGGAGTWDGALTGNFYNGSADTTWNNSTLGDSIVFGGTASTVTVASAGVTASTLTFNSPNYIVSGGTITMMGNQTINAANGAVSFNGAIAGNAGLTVTGSGNVTLGATNSFTGGLFVTGGGTASFTADLNLGASGQPVYLDNGTLRYPSTGLSITNRVINIEAGGGAINTPNPASGGKLIINGTGLLSGSGTITKTGNGWLTIYGSNASTFTGNWNVNGGVLEMGTLGDVGSGAITVNSGGELATNVAGAITNTLMLNAGSTIGADFSSTGATGTFAGPIIANGNFNVRLGNFWSTVSQKVVISGNLSGAETLTTISASGAATSTSLASLTLSGNNASFSGGITIPFGTVTAALSQTNTLGTGRLTLAGGKLALAGQITQTGSAGAAAPVTVNGFNKDVIYGNPDIGTTTTGGVDGTFGFFQTGFTPTSGLNSGTALTSGIVSSNVTSAINMTPFTLQSFTNNNALQIAEGQTGTLTLATPSPFKTLSVLATSAFGSDETPNVKITFADGTSVNTTYKAFDWSMGTDSTKLNADVFGTTGIERYSSTQSPGWDQRPFGIYETDIDLTNIGGVDYSSEMVSSLTFTATDFDTQNRGKTSIFAVSGASRGFITGATQTYANPVTVSADSTLDVSVSLNAVMGTLAIGSNKLSITSADTTANPYSVSFGATTLSGNATFDVAPSSGGGTGTVSLANISGSGSITKSNTGTLKLRSAGNIISGALAINGGTVEIDGNTTAASLSGNGTGTLNIIGAKLSLGSHTGADDAANLAGLSLSSGTLDVNNNDLIVHYTAGNSIASTIRGLLVSGFNGGSWNGPGIDSLAAQIDPTSLTAIGYADNSVLNLTSFDGINPGPNAVLVKYTYYGDSNLDGKVDVNDFKLFLAGLAATNASTWEQGDYTYDGHVDLGNDFNLFLINYLDGGGSLGALEPLIQESDLSLSQKSMLLSAVPEPSLAGLAFVGLLLGRRRKNYRKTNEIFIRS